MSRGNTAGQEQPEGPLRVTVVNSDLSFVAEPLFIGHYSSSRLTGTEWVTDRRIGQTMSRSLRLGLYPAAYETNQVFVNSRMSADEVYLDPRPQAVIVVGLGEEGALTESALSRTVRQGVLVWSQRAAETRVGTAAGTLTVAATLIGSGGLGVSVGQSARAIAQGVLDANQKLTAEGCLLVGHLRLIELYLDRATEAWRTLRVLGTANLNVDSTIASGRGPLKRTLDASYRGAEYDIISVTSEPQSDGHPLIGYCLSTKRARTEVTATKVQLPLIRDMVERNSNLDAPDYEIGRTLFNLLVPIEIESFLAGTTELQLELGKETAGIPWELLDMGGDSEGKPEPWAIRTKLLRKLRTSEFRRQVSDAGLEGAALVIGEPLVPTRYQPLPAAQAEAAAVADLLRDSTTFPLEVVPLIAPAGSENRGADADTIIKALHARSWRIIHISGHGEAPPPLPAPDPSRATGLHTRGVSRGVVLSDEKYLGPEEVRNLRFTPELVFLNCCHLAHPTDAELLAEAPAPARAYDRAQFAAGIAEELIKIGVRCVIAAGWAVEDDTAGEFATVFYRRLLGGERFVDAVAEARRAAWKSGGNTWAAYQCYGDPDWQLYVRAATTRRSVDSEKEFAGVASPSGLRLALHTLAVRSQYQGAARPDQLVRLRYLEKHFLSEQPELGWAAIGSIAESFAAAWAEAGAPQQAIDWYRKAAAAPDGSASIRASEQLANLRVRQAWESVADVLDARGRLPASAAAKSPQHRAVEQRLDKAAGAAREEIDGAITLLKKLLSLRETSERHSLLASAYKRLAMLEEARGARPGADAWIADMVDHYERAEKLAGKESGADRFYAASNCLAAEVAQRAGTSGWKGMNRLRLATVKKELEQKNRVNADFWSKVGEAELLMYEALAAGNLCGGHERLIQLFNDLGDRVTGTRFWSSVYDQAWFVLQRYVPHATVAERRGAKAVLRALHRLRTRRKHPAE